MNRQDFIVQEFEKSCNKSQERKEICKDFVKFCKQYGHKITCAKANKILNQYTNFADMSKYIGKRKKYYVEILV